MPVNIRGKIAGISATIILALLIYVEVASDIGNAIVAFLNLSGPNEGWVWFGIVCSVGMIIAVSKKSKNKGVLT